MARSSPPTRSPARRVARGLVLATSAALAAVVVWYGAGRLRASHAVRMYEVEVPEPGHERPARRLRVAAWNIAHGRGLARSNWDSGDRQQQMRRLARIASALIAFDADLVVLNEVDFDASWSHRQDQALLLAHGAGYRHVATQRNIDAQLPGLSFRFGNALLSRHPLAGARLLDYPPLRRWESVLAGHKRGLLATVRPRGAPELRVAAVHLEHRSEGARVAAAKKLLALSRAAGPPLMLAGDFNSTPDGYPEQHTDREGRSALSLLLRSGRFHACTEIEPEEPWLSFRADRPTRLIDWVLLPPEFRFLGCQTLALDSSDHRPVLVELELPGA